MLCSLLVAMTLTSGLLLLLEPGPSAPRTAPPTLMVRDRSAQTALFSTVPAVESGRWDAIVIHDSRTTSGSLATLNKLHEARGLGGLAYHFVVDNGQGGDNGQIEIGSRWQQQKIGAHSTGSQGAWRNRRAIGICLVGHGDRQGFTQPQLESLLWLTHELQRKFGISPDRVYIDVDQESGGGVGRLFPVAWCRQQLLSDPNP